MKAETYTIIAIQIYYVDPECEFTVKRKIFPHFPALNSPHTLLLKPF